LGHFCRSISSGCCNKIAAAENSVPAAAKAAAGDNAAAEVNYLINEYAEMVAGWVLGTHNIYCKSSSLFTRK
jgi:hypothetical protein